MVKDFLTNKLPQPQFSVTVFGNPKPLKRARITRRGAYDPNWEDKVEFAKQVVASRTSCFSTPLIVLLEYGLPIPSSLSIKRKKWLIGKIHVVRPDLSNLVKFTEDALNGILWEDDALIHTLIAEKTYDEKPFTRVTIWAPLELELSL